MDHDPEGLAARRTGRQRVLTVALFALAGAAFVVLSVLAGFFFLVAYGVDVPSPEPLRVRLQAVSAVAWAIGLIAAVGGPVLGVRGRTAGRSPVGWASADLLVVGAMVVVVLVDGSIGTG